MINTYIEKLGQFLARKHIASLEERAEKAEEKANQRVAKTLLAMDPMEMLLDKYKGVFWKEWERVEDPLDDVGKFGMQQWGYGLRHDPYFLRLVQWICDKQGNQAIKRDRSPDQIFFSRAILAATLLFQEEVDRLGNAYEDMMRKNRESGFDQHLTVSDE